MSEIDARRFYSAYPHFGNFAAIADYDAVLYWNACKTLISNSLKFYFNVGAHLIQSE